MVDGDGLDCVAALRALADETRVRIVGLLCKEQLGVGEISERLTVTPYNVSKHLRILREAGLIEFEKQGREHLYSVPPHIRRSQSAHSILDLGCCSFQFERTSTRG